MAVFIAKEQPTLQKVFVVAIDRAANVAVGIRPLSGFDVNPGSN
jgi:hypothetical protein